MSFLIILTGDFNQFQDKFLRSHYGYVQMVNNPTRNNAVLDKIWTNMAAVYEKPVVLSELGTSDHNMVLLSPACNPSLEKHHDCVTLSTRLKSLH